MTRLTIDLSMSLDGYVAGPDPSQQDPRGVGGERLREWAFAAQSWRGAHGRQGGEPGPDADAIQESALDHARDAGGGKDLHVAGGAEAVQQYRVAS